MRTVASFLVLLSLAPAVFAGTPVVKARAYLAFGRGALASKHYDRAEGDLRQALRQDPSLTEAHLLLARLYSGTDHAERAAEEYAAVLRHKPAVAAATEARTGLAAMRTKLQEPLPIDAARTRATANPGDAEAHVALASLLYRAQKWDDARTEADAALKIDPQESHAQAILAQLLRRDGAPGDARKLFEAALAHDKKNDNLLGSLGELSLEQGDAKRAIRYLSAAVEIAPEHAQWREGLAAAYTKAGDAKAAAREGAMATWLKTDPLEGQGAGVREAKP